MNDTILERLDGVSSEPGVYIIRDRSGAVIYVGKAKNLKKRLSSYFKKPVLPDLKTAILVEKTASFETIITGTENDALILESNLIKQYHPRYNVILKDDKRYPSLRIDPAEPYPHLQVVRKVARDGALYFGPYTAPGAMYQTLKVINRHFKLRKCRNSVLKNRTRPCLNYQMGGCLGPCCLDVDPAVYAEIVREVVLFLKGRTHDLIRKIREEMLRAAENPDTYELAGELRDKMTALQKVIEKQVAITTDFKDRDVVGMAGSGESAILTLLTVRGGYLTASRHFPFEEILTPDGELVAAFIRQYYEQASFIPKEILTSVPIEDRDLISSALSALKGESVKILHPRRGEKVRLIQMADRNAADEMERRTSDAAAKEGLLRRLQHRLHMDRLPARIECFDNSNILGAAPVSGMVVFENGVPSRKDYRRYVLRTVEGPDDYAGMSEALKRRYGKGEGSRPFPDLLVVDGGKGQLNIAVAVMRELGLDGAFHLIGIAKKDEAAGETRDKIYLPGRVNPVNLGADDPAYRLLQQIRDEAHRHAITFHRRRRGKQALTSALDAAPGIGPMRKRALLAHFGSIQKIRAATLEELRAVPGISEALALALQDALRRGA